MIDNSLFESVAQFLTQNNIKVLTLFVSNTMMLVFYNQAVVITELINFVNE